MDNYGKFGRACNSGLFAGFFTIAQEEKLPPTSTMSWHTGSDITTQVNYARFGADCYHGLIVGFSAVIQTDATSHVGWYHGSGTPYNTTQVDYGRLGGTMQTAFNFMYGMFGWDIGAAVSHEAFNDGSISRK